METKNETYKIIDDKMPSASVEMKKKRCCSGNNFPLGFILGFITMTLITLGIIYFVLVPYVNGMSIKGLIKLDEAKSKTESFINENLMGKGAKITVKNAGEESGLYKITIDPGTGQNVDTYVTKDGKFFLPQVMDMEKIASENKKASANATPTPTVAELKKSDKPEVELFVMSYCPYGTQIEKGILPAIAALENKVNFDLKFVDYAMHGEKEMDEQLTQYCIKTGENAKFTGYLQCFLEDGDSARCLKQAKVNTTKLSSCIDATDTKYKIKANFHDKSTYKGNFPPFNIYKDSNVKYGVAGSPTLVINGATVNSGRDSASLLKTICSAFNNPPKECESALSSTSPAPGFGTGTTTNTNSASCN